jgi:dTDP-4-dehydrorhamnose 3,5-epimerase
MPATFEDDRGSFTNTYRYSEFAAFGITETFVQDAQSRSRQGVLRGLHYQKKNHAQGKLVRVVAGRIYDVAVDIRRESASYGQWVGIELEAEDRGILYIPPGFAHGFCALTSSAEVSYKTTQEHAPDMERGIVWDDPGIAISWPVREPILSRRDAALPRLCDADNDF